MAHRAYGEPRKKLKSVARALYAGDANPEPDSLIGELTAKLGLDDGEVECWPENLDALRIFDAVSTQWNVGMNGVIGLRYEAIEPVMRMLGIAHKERAALFDALRVMENEALKVMRGN